MNARTQYIKNEKNSRNKYFERTLTRYLLLAYLIRAMPMIPKKIFGNHIDSHGWIIIRSPALSPPP